MKIIRKIVESLTPPGKSDLWIKGGILKYFSNGSWKSLGGETQKEETDKNSPYIITIYDNQNPTYETPINLGKGAYNEITDAAYFGKPIVLQQRNHKNDSVDSIYYCISVINDHDMSLFLQFIESDKSSGSGIIFCIVDDQNNFFVDEVKMAPFIS